MALTLRLTSAAPPSCTEHDLVAAARRGDDRAFEELYARYRTRIAAYILGPVGDHGRAEDLAQEVFLSALRRLRDTEQPIAFKPWIYEIAKNACIDEYRRTKRAREVSLEADDDLGAHDRVRLSSDLTPDAAVENKQRLDDLRGAFGGLSESHHKLLVMRELEGLSYDEIGTRRGMSRAMVESTLFRARRKLTEEYDELVSGRRCEQVQTAIDTLGARSLRSFGLRERRQLARHLAHCQPCRRMAHMSGVDESIFKPRGIAEKIAALLPFPILGWRRGGGGKGSLAARGSHQFAAVQSLQNAASFTDTAVASVGLGRAAAAAVAAIALASAGGGLVTGLGSHPSSPPTLGFSAQRSSDVSGSLHGHAASTTGSAAAAGASAGSGLHSSASGTGRGGSSHGTRGAGSSRSPAAGSGSRLESSTPRSGTSSPAGSTGAALGGARLPAKLPALSAPSSTGLPTVSGVLRSILPTKPAGGGTPTPPKVGLPTIQVPKVPTVMIPSVTVSTPATQLTTPKLQVP